MELNSRAWTFQFETRRDFDLSSIAPSFSGFGEAEDVGEPGAVDVGFREIDEAADLDADGIVGFEFEQPFRPAIENWIELFDLEQQRIVSGRLFLDVLEEVALFLVAHVDGGRIGAVERGLRLGRFGDAVDGQRGFGWTVEVTVDDNGALAGARAIEIVGIGFFGVGARVAGGNG